MQILKFGHLTVSQNSLKVEMLEINIVSRFLSCNFSSIASYKNNKKRYFEYENNRLKIDKIKKHILMGEFHHPNCIKAVGDHFKVSLWTLQVLAIVLPF